MNGRSTYFLVFCMIVLSTSSCEKDIGAGSIICTVKSNGSPIQQVKAYLKYGVNQKPVHELSQADYDKTGYTDVNGQVYFDNLPPQNYYLLLTGLNPETNKTFSKDTILQVRKRFRDNEYDVDIEIN